MKLAPLVNNSAMAALLRQSTQNIHSAGMTGGDDYQRAINALLGTGALPSNIENTLLHGVDQACANYNRNNRGQLPCADIQNMIRTGQIDYAALGQSGGRYLCEIIRDRDLDCNRVAGVIGQGIQNGGFSFDGLSGIATDYACNKLDVQSSVGISCRDLSNGAMITTCFFTGECSGTIAEGTRQLGKILPEPARDLLQIINPSNGSGNIITSVVGNLGRLF